MKDGMHAPAPARGTEVPEVPRVPPAPRGTPPPPGLPGIAVSQPRPATGRVALPDDLTANLDETGIAEWARQVLTLHLGAHAFRPLVPDELADLLGVLLRDAFLQADREPVLLARELRVAWVESLQRDAAPDQLVLEDVEHGLGALLAVGADLHGMIAGPCDGGAHAAEIETGSDLLRRLVECVVHLLAIDLADDVKTAVRHCNSNPGDTTPCPITRLLAPGAGVVDLRCCRAEARRRSQAVGRGWAAAGSRRCRGRGSCDSHATAGRSVRYPSQCPSCGTAYGRLPERPKGAVCKTVGLAYVGSNPTPATRTNTSSGALWRP